MVTAPAPEKYCSLLYIEAVLDRLLKGELEIGHGFDTEEVEAALKKVREHRADMCPDCGEAEVAALKAALDVVFAEREYHYSRAEAAEADRNGWEQTANEHGMALAKAEAALRDCLTMAEAGYARTRWTSIRNRLRAALAQSKPDAETLAYEAAANEDNPNPPDAPGGTSRDAQHRKGEGGGAPQNASREERPDAESGRKPVSGTGNAQAASREPNPGARCPECGGDYEAEHETMGTGTKDDPFYILCHRNLRRPAPPKKDPAARCYCAGQPGSTAHCPVHNDVPCVLCGGPSDPGGVRCCDGCCHPSPPKKGSP